MKLDSKSRGQTKLLNLSLAIWYLYGLKREIRISSQVQRTFSISGRSTRRNLTKLQEVGLIAVTLHKGRAPLVELRIDGDSTSNGLNRSKRMEG